MPNQDLLKYIKDSFAQNVSKDEIRRAVLEAGWAEQDVATAFLVAEGGVAPVAQVVLASALQPEPASVVGQTPQYPAPSFAQPALVNAQPSPHRGTLLWVMGIIIVALLVAGGIAIWVVTNNKGEMTPQKVVENVVPVEQVPAVVAVVKSPVLAPTTMTKKPIQTVTPKPMQASTNPTAVQIKTADEIEIHGKAAKGIILNAKIRVSDVVDGKMSGIAKEVEIGPSGDFLVSIPKPKGVTLLSVVARSGSIEKDEVIKVDVPLPLDFKFRAAVDLVDARSKSVEVNITAYSEAAVVLAEKNGGLLPKNVNLANSGISNILGLDFLGTRIIQSNDTVGLASATLEEKKMTILNGTIASMASTDEMSCGPKQTYGETINCTIAKFADHFTLTTSAPYRAHLGDVGYNAMIRHMALFKAGL